LVSGLGHRCAVWVYVARIPWSSSASTGCAAGFVMSPSCSLATSFVSLTSRVVGTFTLTWWLAAYVSSAIGSSSFKIAA
jgi:hypothetical protein